MNQLLFADSIYIDADSREEQQSTITKLGKMCE